MVVRLGKAITVPLDCRLSNLSMTYESSFHFACDMCSIPIGDTGTIHKHYLSFVILRVRWCQMLIFLLLFSTIGITEIYGLDARDYAKYLRF
ncbi:hypothetical protein KIN20_006531 [Parelaphostrongylus tenuis]|uniref:Uncharacterized protein n=1 Tax=Parelaphostrongylus tenuis TaxID=148309 RepID=A0AAD5MN42_PARTN|nr:hypothetical protein KIN20_006531 [Parelaphostrongylus tenuis]